MPEEEIKTLLDRIISVSSDLRITWMNIRFGPKWTAVTAGMSVRGETFLEVLEALAAKLPAFPDDSGEDAGLPGKPETGLQSVL